MRLTFEIIRLLALLDISEQNKSLKKLFDFTNKLEYKTRNFGFTNMKRNRRVYLTFIKCFYIMREEKILYYKKFVYAGWSRDYSAI